jgi:hypothetical protein
LEERLQTQAETNQLILGLIDEASKDPKKYLPYGPTLMNLYSKERIEINNSALLRTISDEKKIFCNKQCKGNDECFTKCENFFTWASNYGMSYFHNVHKYAYTPTVSGEEE